MAVRHPAVNSCRTRQCDSPPTCPACGGADVAELIEFADGSHVHDVAQCGTPGCVHNPNPPRPETTAYGDAWRMFLEVPS